MKPNDKAIAAARKAYCEAAVSPMEMALEAACAALEGVTEPPR